MEARSTIRQTTQHSVPGMNVASTNTGSYSKDKHDRAKTTIKETTLLRDRTGVLTGQDKQRSYDAEYNMEIDDKKEILTYNRAPGPKSDQMGPFIYKNNVVLREYNNAQRPVTGYKILNRTCGNLVKDYTRNKNQLNHINYHTNSNFISTMKNNPLVNNVVHQNKKIIAN